ncbi:HAMP domain-containing sensor histidine kinase [Sulfuriferula plumbiphila]|uniref:HAMP domain-containing sensor histidine kinase n=1 Tax=Sulfuriferula plumbiphila TaxID=171865 RepID=UPI001CB9A602|nr:HAMP domain-containing sensor histidine kinase [Sulfuriferula plumbiphila]
MALPLIIALINSAVSIDRLAGQSRKAVYQAAQIAHGSRVLLDEITTMERSVRQALILGDASLLEGYFQAHAKFGNTAMSLSSPSLRPDQKRVLDKLTVSESAIFQQVSAARRSPEGLQEIVRDFVPLLDSARTFSSGGYALIEREVNAMQDMAGHVRSVVVWQLLALVPFAMLLALGFSVLIARPIRQIDAAIRTLGQGEFSKAVSVAGPQDLRYLGQRLDWMRRRLLELEEQKTRFLRHVSHELKTPLTAIREGADLLAEGVAGELSVQQRQIANILYTNSIQLQKRIEDLLNYSALQTEKTALVKRRESLARVVNAVLQDQNLAIMNKGLQVDLACPELMIECDQQKVSIIVDNLVSNAVKFSPSGGCIKIWANQVGELAWLDVTDAGPGVDETDWDKVFEPFYQGRRAPERHVQGTGLGLSIAREYARAHGGNIELVKQAGAGAHFRLTLPIRDPQDIHA